MGQNIGAYMINIRNKKWWWPLFRFCVDLAVKNAFQLYHLQPLNQGQKSLGICFNLLGFRREIVQVYHSRFRSEKTLPVISQKTPKESIQSSDMMGSITGLPKETNDDVPNVQKQANIFVKRKMLVFIQIVLSIFILNRF